MTCLQFPLLYFILDGQPTEMGNGGSLIIGSNY